MPKRTKKTEAEKAVEVAEKHIADGGTVEGDKAYADFGEFHLLAREGADPGLRATAQSILMDANIGSHNEFDGPLRIIGSNYGSSVAAVDFPTYAAMYLQGRLPADQLIAHMLDTLEADMASVTGPKALPMPPVPKRCTENSPTMTMRVMGSRRRPNRRMAVEAASVA